MFSVRHSLPLPPREVREEEVVQLYHRSLVRPLAAILNDLLCEVYNWSFSSGGGGTSGAHLSQSATVVKVLESCFHEVCQWF